MIREAIRARLKELKITQNALASDLGLNRTSVNGFLVGRRPIPLADLEKILKHLGLTIKPGEQ